MTDDLIPGGVAEAIAEAQHGDPFSVLGLHKSKTGWIVRAYIPAAAEIAVVTPTGGELGELKAGPVPGFFAGVLSKKPPKSQYRLKIRSQDAEWLEDDPYRFAPVIGELDEHLFNEGSHRALWHVLGAHPTSHEGQDGVHFAVWAPNARRVSVVGDFNFWDGRRHPMRQRGATGIWEIFLPGVAAGAAYKYEVLGAHGGAPVLKSDPVGFGAELRPATASRIEPPSGHEWRDAEWLERRAETHALDRPISIYEAHIGSWQHRDDGEPLTYAELGDRLIPYLKEMGFTHLELLPITEHPFDGSWGYQPIGLYAPTRRYGSPDEFRGFVDACHQAGIGLILDWVPGHFPTDQHGLALFDGTHLYEHADPREGFHQDWNTLIFNYGRREVENYLVANALYWCREHHIDGLRVDAVASMLYRDYSRKDGEWVPNEFGGRENLEAIAFLRRMNEVVYGECPGVVTIAEESTAWPGVSSPVYAGGLGFGYKWNMGWMNDTLDYMGHDPVYRKYHHHQMTFGLHYAFSENFILPLSHDEVVHGKGSILARMPGDDWQKFANLRAYYGFMWGHPGKKLLFMGQEFAQGAEWDNDKALDWHLLDVDWHAGVQRLVRDLNAVYHATPALHELDTRAEGFRWIDGGNAEQSVYAWLRQGKKGSAPVLAVSNFTPMERSSFRVGVPAPGHWREILNTNAEIYRGSGSGNLGGVISSPTPWNGCDHSIEITLPALSTLMFQYTE